MKKWKVKKNNFLLTDDDHDDDDHNDDEEGEKTKMYHWVVSGGPEVLLRDVIEHEIRHTMWPGVPCSDYYN